MTDIKRVLVANRGEIALRIIRACHEEGMEAVAVYSEVDRLSPHVRAADAAVALGPAPAAESYLDAAKLVAAARHSGCQAIHPGYGFLSERAPFAEAVTEAGLTFVGPSAAAIRAMGDKTEARRRMQAAGVPIVPGTTRPLADHAQARPEAARLGYPVLLKAVAGGGGKGGRGAPTGGGAALGGGRGGGRARNEAGARGPRAGPPRSGAPRLPRPAQGGGGGGGERDAAGPDGGGARVGVRGSAERGAEGLRGGGGVPREISGTAAPHRDPGARRLVRARGVPGRARVQHPAAASEAHRGGALARRDARAAAAAERRRHRRRRSGRLSQRRHDRVSARAKRRVLFPGNEHPSPGRAPGDRASVRGGHRA